MKDKGLSQKWVAGELRKTEKQLSDILTKNSSIDVFDVKQIGILLNYNFFTTPVILDGFVNEEVERYIIKRKKVKVSFVLEVDDDSMERRILEDFFDKPTAKKLLGE